MEMDSPHREAEKCITKYDLELRFCENHTELSRWVRGGICQLHYVHAM